MTQYTITAVTRPTATLIANSTLTTEGLHQIYDAYEEAGAEFGALSPENSSGVIEYAARGCYEAYGKKNAATRETGDYLKNIMDQQHFSVLEHSSYTFEFKRVSRALTHELVRHRHFSFSQVSQRYVWDEHNIDVIIPPDLRWLFSEGVYGETDAPPLLHALAGDRSAQRAVYNALRYDQDKSRKEAAQAARAFLTNAAAAHIVVTGNARSWIEFVNKRNHPAADLEIQELAAETLDQLAEIEPLIFGDEAREHWNVGNEQKEARHNG